MKKRKGSFLQRMMAVLLSAVLVTGMVSNETSMTVLAQEGSGEQSVSENDVELTEPAEETNPEKQAPDAGTGQEMPGIVIEEETQENVMVMAAGDSITQDGRKWNIPDTVNISVGEEKYGGITGGGTALYNETYSFASSDSAVATVRAEGGGYTGFYVTGISEGTATITFTCSYKVTNAGETKSVSGSFDVVVTAADKYTVTVNSGAGGGEYEAGATVTIKANAPASGKQFDKWTVDSGSVTLADATNATTTFTMPAGAVSVTATYKDSVSDADKVAAAKTVVENTLAGITATNATTKEKILNEINTALSNAGITGVTVGIDKFQNYNATTSAAGHIEGVISISCGVQSQCVNMEKPIAKLTNETGSGDSGGGSGDSGSGSGNNNNDNGGSNNNSDSGSGSSDSGNNNNDNGGSNNNSSDSGNGSSGSNGTAGGGSQSGGSGADTSAKAPATVIITPPKDLEDAALTETEKQQKAGGADIRFELDVQVVAAEAGAADRVLVEEALRGSAAGYTLGQYLDINLYKVIGDSRTAIAETDGKITIRIDVPEDLKNTDSSRTRTFAVIRVHDGRVELLADLDNDADTITIATDRFSTYAVVYKDAANSGNGGSIQLSAENGSSEGSGGAKDNEPKTGDSTPLELYATLTMIAGLAYLLLYFTDRERGMTEEMKKELVSRLVGWAKRGGKIRKWFALAVIFVLLVYYHSIGKKTCAGWKTIYGE